MNIDHWLLNETGRLVPEVLHQRTLHTGPWVNLVPKGSWPEGMGESLSVVTYERSLPTTSLTWGAVSFSDGTGAAACLPETAQVEWGQTTRSYNLEHAALESPDLCVNDLRNSFKRERQLNAIWSILGQQTSWVWEQRHRSEYVRIAQHKIIAREGLPEDDTAFPTQLPTSRLTAGMLARVYLKLNRDGARRDGGAVDVVNNKPQYIAIMSSETDHTLLMEDYKIREDIRNSDRVPELLAPYGVDRPYKGFYHLIDDFCPRWEYDDEDGWVEVPPYVRVASTKGYKWELNPDYETATYEDTIIFLPSVFKSLVPDTITTPGGSTKFDPVKYQGTWSWQNIKHREDNPDGTIGHFRGVFMAGSEPVFPQFGYVIRHLRAEIPLALVDQYGNASI